MHPYSILNYYPTYEILDNIVSRKGHNKINLFIDLKNVLQSIYMEHCIKGLVESTIKTNYIDTSVFSSVIPFLSFHKLYCAKRGLDIKFYIFFEVGESYYHKKLNRKYKISRKIDDLYGLDRAKRQKFTEILQNNFKLVDKSLNRVPGIKVLRLENLEADFVPYYLITRNKVDKDSVNIIYSNDHDMWQCCMEDTYIYSKATNKTKRIIEQGKPIKKLLKIEDTNLPDDCITLAMSVMGDPGDDVHGIKGIGPKTFDKIGNELLELVGGMNTLRDNIMNNNDIFPGLDNTSKLNKNLHKIISEERNNNLISNNMKQVDFELISRYLESPVTTEMMERKKQIDNILNDNKISSYDSMYRALLLNRVFIQEDQLELLYWRKDK